MSKKNRLKKYLYKIEKQSTVSSDTFESAFHCAVSAVASVLYDYDVNVTSEIPTIIITINDNAQSMSFTLDECNEKIKFVFMDNVGITYPEFKGVSSSEYTH